MNRYMVYSTVIIPHEVIAEGPDEAMEASWRWANRELPGKYEVLDHSINWREEVT